MFKEILIKFGASKFKQWTFRLIINLHALIWSKKIYKFKFSPFMQNLDLKTINNFFDAAFPQKNLLPIEQNPQKKNIVIIAPHPDDEVLGAFGLLSSLKSKITVIYLSSGSIQDSLIREKEARNVCKKMNVNCFFFNKNLNDNEINFEEIVKKILEIRPNIISLPFIADDHIHHLISNKIILQIPKFINSEIWAYQVYTTICSNVFIDLSNRYSEKEEIMKEYKSQMKGFDWIHFNKGLNAWNSRFTLTEPSLYKKQIKYSENYFVVNLNEYRKICEKHIDDFKKIKRISKTNI
tara:strand:- start:9397 stop:10278 length:882 start_codon:yes stop_codon:yes gene_type:complete